VWVGLLALVAFLPSVIFFFFTQKKGVGLGLGGWAAPVDLPGCSLRYAGLLP